MRRTQIFTSEHRKSLSESHKGYVMPESQKQKISASLKGRVISKSHREKLSLIKLGVKLSAAHYASVCKANSLKIGTTWKMAKYSRMKISEVRKGMKFSDDHRKNLSVAQTGKFGPKCSRWVEDRSKVHWRRRFNMDFTIPQKNEILVRDKYACQWCNARPQFIIRAKKILRNTVKLEIDHIIPVAAGGTRETSNGQVLCKPCHSSKRKSDWVLIRKFQKINKKVA